MTLSPRDALFFFFFFRLKSQTSSFFPSFPLPDSLNPAGGTKEGESIGRTDVS